MSRFDAERFDAIRRERGVSWGSPLVHRATTESTNDDALAAAKAGAPEGAVFVADSQTRGRGRRGHRWTSPAGENLLVSLLLRPDLPADRASALTLAVGLAVRDATAASVPSAVAIKWPNDVIAHEPDRGWAKLAGILVESQLQAGRTAALVVGIGLNVHMRDLPDPIESIATSLARLGAAAPNRESILVEVLARLEMAYGNYLRGGLSALLDRIRPYDGLLDRQVDVDGAVGIARGIDETGALLVEMAGERRRIVSGTVRALAGFRPPEPAPAPRADGPDTGDS